MGIIESSEVVKMRVQFREGERRSVERCVDQVIVRGLVRPLKGGEIEDSWYWRGLIREIPSGRKRYIREYG
jgi:hypothetical protein